jgi:hypothetical protein
VEIVDCTKRLRVTATLSFTYYEGIEGNNVDNLDELMDDIRGQIRSRTLNAYLEDDETEVAEVGVTFEVVDNPGGTVEIYFD